MSADGKASQTKVSVLIPVFNECWTLREIVRRVYEQEALLHEVVVVDDCSTDGSRERLVELESAYASRRCRLRAVFKPKNEGKGAALKAGLAELTGDVVIVQDADLEYNPHDYPALLAPLLDGRADAVYGSRFTGAERRALLFWHMVANKTLTLFSNLLTNLSLSDVWTGYKAFRVDLLRAVTLRSRGFGFEPEITVKIAKLGARIYEVPISYQGRTEAEGKKIGARDAVTGMLALIRAWLFDDPAPEGVGAQTLHVMSGAERYNQFIYDQLKPRLGRRVVEIGAGVGNISRLLLDRDELALTDEDSGYVRQLENTYRGWSYVRAQRLDIIHPERTPGADSLKGRFDSAVCCQVLEHLDDDAAALSHMRDLLAPGGRLLLMVPAHQAIHGTMDKALGHHRRYESRELNEKLAAAGFEVESIRFLNPLAIPGWWLNGRVLGRTVVPSLQVGLFDRMTFIVRWLARFDLPFGLLLYAVARRQEAA